MFKKSNIEHAFLEDTMLMLKIIRCTDPMRWYADKIGEYVPFLGDSCGEYKSREPEGYINFVQYEDSEIIKMG